MPIPEVPLEILIVYFIILLTTSLALGLTEHPSYKLIGPLTIKVILYTVRLQLQLTQSLYCLLVQ